ncbi:MAG: UMP kinase [Lachnospiraceae bacterium]|nr:UMP kinase [Lachnospiraceae bacterium]
MEKQRRVFLKLSGEALADKENGGYSLDVVKDVAKQVKESADAGVQVGVIIGGGNYWRGRTGTEIDRTKSDQIGMLATVMNCIYVSEVFRSVGLKTEIFTPFAVGAMTKLFSKDEANAAFENGKVCFFAGGTGHPYFSTDTGVVLRAIEMEADMVLLAKSIDGVYDKDPMKYPDAVRYDTVSIATLVEKKLDVIDHTASMMCEDNHLPLAVFDLREENSIRNALNGQINGTIVTA